MIKYLNETKKNYLTLSSDGLEVIKFYVDVSFAVQTDFKSRTRSIMTMVQGVVQSVSRGNKLNTMSSTEAVLFSVDDASVYIFWKVLFIKWKGVIFTITYCIKTTRVQFFWKLMIK